MTCCREVLGKSVVGKCACVCGEVLIVEVFCRSVVKECCGKAAKCCRQVLGRSVVERCCEEML